MPAIPSDMPDILVPAALKKRKRDPLQDQAVNLSHSTHFTSSLHPQSQLSRLEYNIPKENNDCMLRHIYVPRKRRVLQQSQHHDQGQPWADRSSYMSNAAQPRLLTPNICVSTSQDTSSPPISPKTLVPIPCTQQILSTSASPLRPCHICHRRPTTREVLDAYADCDLCGQRSCYVCLRQCDSPNCCGSVNLGNHLLKDVSDRLEGKRDGDLGARPRRKICSCCAVEGLTETGTEVVHCLDCVRSQLSPYQTEPPDQWR